MHTLTGPYSLPSKAEGAYQGPLPHPLSSECDTLSYPKPKTQDPYLEGQGDLVNRSMNPISHIVTPIIAIINLLTKSP